MAKFKAVMPDSVIKDMQKIHDNTEHIFGEMTKAGAEVAMNNIKANAPQAVRSSGMMNCLKMTRVYKTPSDGGINTKVAFYGYFTNQNGEKVPAPLVGNVFEYGRSTSRYPKQPFMRKSFAPNQIEKAMLEAQKKASGGLLEE